MAAAEQIGAYQIRLSEPPVLSRPPKVDVMIVVKGYFDDSQTTGKVWALGGYTGGFHHWAEFDSKWRIALAIHDVPYFHMREVSDPKGPFAKWLPSQGHQFEWAAFFGDLAKVINGARLTSICCLVRMEDLQRFNSERGLNLEPYPLAAYGCTLLAGKEYTGHPTELIFDHVEKVDSKLVKAREYADSDKFLGPDGVFDKIVTAPLPKDLTFRDVPALQAADFWVWEYRKNHLKMDSWWSLEDRPKQRGDEQWEHMERWVRDTHGGFEAATRKSAQALMTRPNMHCLIWHYQELCDAHEARGGVWALP